MSKKSKPLKEDGLLAGGGVILEMMQYNEQDYAMYDNVPLEDLLKNVKPGYTNWINVDGLQEKSLVTRIGKHFNLHPLLVDDILNDHQTKTEEFEEHLFFTMKMLHSISGNKIEYEQISFVLGKDYLLSFQEKEGDLFGKLRDRIKKGSGKTRQRKVDYLLYRLVDIIVDSYYKIFDSVGHQIEEVEEDVHNNPTGQEFRRIQRIKKELIFLRKALYPLRDSLSKLMKDESGFIDNTSVRYFSDVYDHVVHLLDSLDTYKDLCSGLMDIHINTMNTRLNEVMKVLAVISTIFMPLTFVVGLYGMNFDDMPELHAHWGYPVVLVIMAVIVISMISYFKYKKWF
ncbi:MAG: magnesium/cobalt transporter CorA [Cytophagales bacterium]|nr:magnesium/cobalt transporter CorA [Cytophagales bacterium]